MPTYTLKHKVLSSSTFWISIFVAVLFFVVYKHNRYLHIYFWYIFYHQLVKRSRRTLSWNAYFQCICHLSILRLPSSSYQLLLILTPSHSSLAQVLCQAQVIPMCIYFLVLLRLKFVFHDFLPPTSLSDILEHDQYLISSCYSVTDKSESL